MLSISVLCPCLQAAFLSAVLAPFAIEAWKTHQTSDSQAFTDAYARISAQLAEYSLPPIAPPGPMHAYAISWTTTFWLLSFTVSLCCALFGLLTKQRMDEFRELREWFKRTEIPHDQRERYQRTMAYAMPTIPSKIARVLPTLLILAIVLFLAGVVTCLWTLRVMASDLSMPVAMAFLILLPTIVALLQVAVTAY